MQENNGTLPLLTQIRRAPPLDLPLIGDVKMVISSLVIHRYQRFQVNHARFTVMPLGDVRLNYRCKRDV